jgi:hypothetical protein
VIFPPAHVTLASGQLRTVAVSAGIVAAKLAAVASVPSRVMA